MEPAATAAPPPAASAAAPAAPPPGRWTRRLLRLTQAVAVVLLGGWLALLTYSALEGHRQASWSDLRSAVHDGDVSEVEVRGRALQGTGQVTIQLRWREGWHSHQATVLQANPRHRVSGRYDRSEVSAVLRRPVPEVLHTLDPDLEVVHAGRRTEHGASAYGWVAPAGTAPYFVLGGLATLLLLAVGPEPRRVTPWGWLWLVLLTGPLGSCAYLLLSGVLSAKPVGTPLRRRMGGGWAFLLALLLGSLSGVLE